MKTPLPLLSLLLLLAVPVFTTDGSPVSEPHPYDVSLGVEDATGVGDGAEADDILQERREVAHSVAQVDSIYKLRGEPRISRDL